MRWFFFSQYSLGFLQVFVQLVTVSCVGLIRDNLSVLVSSVANLPLQVHRPQESVSQSIFITTFLNFQHYRSGKTGRELCELTLLWSIISLSQDMFVCVVVQFYLWYNLFLNQYKIFWTGSFLSAMGGMCETQHNSVCYSTLIHFTNLDFLIGWFLPHDNGLWQDNHLDITIVVY